MALLASRGALANRNVCCAVVRSCWDPQGYCMCHLVAVLWHMLGQRVFIHVHY